MNSSRTSLLVIFSLLLACFTSSALCTLTWREGDVYTVSVIDSTGATAVRSNVTISEGMPHLPNCGIFTTLYYFTLVSLHSPLSCYPFALVRTDINLLSCVVNVIIGCYMCTNEHYVLCSLYVYLMFRLRLSF